MAKGKSNGKSNYASSGSSTTARRSGAQPVTAKNRAMSVKHLKASIAFNKAHGDDHKKAQKADEKALKKIVKGKKAGS